MGFFSWKTSDTNRSIANCYSKRRTFTVFVLCPDGTAIREDKYEGYGDFGGYDIFELVAEWNKDNLTIDYLDKPKRNNWDKSEEGELWYQSALNRYHRDCNMLDDYKSGKDDVYMLGQYGEDWKRIIGINIACYDRQNEALKYPIKFVQNPNLNYDDVKPSKSCPNQGYFYG